MFRSLSFFFRSLLGLARVCGSLLLTLYVVRALWPVPPWTSLWPVDGGHSLRLHPDRPPAIYGLPTAPLTRGARPPNPPAVPRSAQPLKFSRARKNRQGLGVGHGQPQAVAHPRHLRTRARNPSGWVTEAVGARCAKAHQGAQPRGSGGVPPHAEERPRRGPEAASAARSPPKDGRRGVEFAPLWGARVRSAHLPFGLFMALCHPFIDLVATAPCHTPPGVHLCIASRAAYGPSAASFAVGAA